MLTKEELMVTRYKVIAPWPCTPYSVGDLVTISTNKTLFLSIETSDQTVWEPIEHINAYPTLIKPLPWYAERRIEDMPEYVRFGESEMRHTVYKIKEWHLNGIHGVDTVCAIAEEPKDYLLIFGAGKCYPNTESEYLTYKKQTDAR